ncbi:23S rRNA (adenine(2503)-C(2))-methyltransferase RlmN [Candidatus Beckwithbacteria bacterium]|nr:23S rRNA (adenine(2503)-C(2))-methyltransferase RlmN [Candidatus Beckwithbacteria bacterium]
MISDFIQKYNLPNFRIKQFNQAFYHDLIENWEDFFTWPKDLREKLKQEIPFSTLEIARSLTSAKKDTMKILFKVKRLDKYIESVLMHFADGRNTLCISCMVGCPVGCKFCATGKLGFGGNLTSQEMIDQIMYFLRLLKKENQKLSNIVFMGMGEPLLNLDNVWETMQIISHPEKLAMSMRKITVSTSGYIPQFKELVERGYRGRVAVSLHFPTQEMREKYMPVAKIYQLSNLVKALEEFVELTNKRVSFEYVMIKDLNDRQEDARALVKLFHTRLIHFNLIPYNPIKGENFQRSSREQIEKFGEILQQNGIPYSVRLTMGDDIGAACGQLAGEK